MEGASCAIQERVGSISLRFGASSVHLTEHRDWTSLHYSCILSVRTLKGTRTGLHTLLHTFLRANLLPTVTD